MPVLTLPQMMRFIVQFTHLKCCWLKFTLICWDTTCDLVERGEGLARQSRASLETLSRSFSPVQMEIKTGREISHWSGHSENQRPSTIKYMCMKMHKSKHCKYPPNTVDTFMSQSRNPQVKPAKCRGKPFFHPFVFNCATYLWNHLDIAEDKTLLSLYRWFQGYKAPFPEALKSVEAPKVQWSMPCPTASCTCKAQGCS